MALLRRWRLLGLLVAVLVAVVATAVLVERARRVPPPTLRDVGVDVIDGPPGATEQVRIDGTLYVPERTPAPAILLAHGFGGSKDSVAAQADELARRGFVVLTFSARGFGHSTGQIALNAPDYEVADARQLVTWLAGRPEVRLDSPGDPRVGVTGASYGGALALSLAKVDHRVDAVVPVIAWDDLAAALLPNAAGSPGTATPAAGSSSSTDGVFKRSWAGILFGAGFGSGVDTAPRGTAAEAGQPDDGSADAGASGSSDTSRGTGEAGAAGTAGTSGAAGSGGTAGSGSATGAGAGGGGSAVGGGPAGAGNLLEAGCGRFRPEVCQAYYEVATTGRASAEAVDVLRRASPSALTSGITAPTMLVQGELDTLFGLDQADAAARQIAAAGAPLKVVWYNGGHDGGAPGQRLRNRINAWFDFHLAGRGPDPGTGFDYAVRGTFQRSGAASVRWVYAPTYPGLAGGTPVERRELRLNGGTSTVLTPPGGSPAAISTVPGLGSLGNAAVALGGVGVDLPGQSASFITDPLDSQLLVAGAPQVRLKVAAIPGATGAGAVLFVKLYDVAPDGTRTLPGGAVAPLRVNGLPGDGTPVEVTVALAGVVRPVEPGHRLAVVVSTTDQAYALPTQPAAFTVGLADAGSSGISLPTVDGRSAADTPLPRTPLVGLGALLVALLAVALAAAVRGRRRRGSDVQADLAGVPLVIDGLTKTYPGGLKAVDELSFRVDARQVLGLLGPNGAGKTTTLRMLMGLIRPEAGEIRVFGERVTPGAPVLSRLGSFVEGPGLLPHLSGMRNLRLYWAATGRPAADARLDEALEIAGLGSAVHRRVSTYSHGMKQRLAIAQAMLGLPDLLVLDEPTNGLDPPQIREMRDVLRRYAATGRTVLVSSHLLAEVEQTCTHVVVMHRGRLVAAGAVADIVAGGGQATFRVDSPATAADVLRSADGVTGVRVDGQLVHADLNGMPRASAVAALVAAGVGVEQAGPRRRLEDAFLQLVSPEGGAP